MHEHAQFSMPLLPHSFCLLSFNLPPSLLPSILPLALHVDDDESDDEDFLTVKKVHEWAASNTPATSSATATATANATAESKVDNTSYLC